VTQQTAIVPTSEARIATTGSKVFPWKKFLMIAIPMGGAMISEAVPKTTR
jgi:hypothetical protein